MPTPTDITGALLHLSSAFRSLNLEVPTVTLSSFEEGQKLESLFRDSVVKPHAKWSGDTGVGSSVWHEANFAGVSVRWPARPSTWATSNPDRGTADGGFLMYPDDFAEIEDAASKLAAKRLSSCRCIGGPLDGQEVTILYGRSFFSGNSGVEYDHRSFPTANGYIGFWIARGLSDADFRDKVRTAIEAANARPDQLGKPLKKGG